MDAYISTTRDVLLMNESPGGGDTDSEDATELSDSEGEVIQNGLVVVPRAFQRVDIPGFSKRTYGVDVAADAALERRHKSAKLDEQLEDLRAVLPEVSTRSKEKTNVVVDAYHYITALQREVEDLNGELLEDVSAIAAQTRDEQFCEAQSSVSCHSGLRQQPMVDVVRRDGLLEVCIVCDNRPGLLVDVMEAVESRGLSITQARIACHNETVVEYLTLENEDPETSLTEGEKEAESVDEEEEVRRVRALLIHAICTGGNFGTSDDHLL